MSSTREITYIKHQNIDAEKWDKCIDNAENHRIYATYWHLDRTAEYWDALVLGDYEYVMPLPVKRKWGISYVYQPLYCQQLGIFPAPVEEIAKQFYSTLKTTFKYIDTQLNAKVKSVQHEQEMTFSPRKNYLLALNMNYAGLFEAYSTNTRRNLTKANKNDLHVVAGISLKDYMEFKSENLPVKLSSKVLNNLKRLIAFGQYKGVGKIYGVYTPGNELCAAVYFCRYKERMIYMNAVSNALGKETGAMFVLIDSFIQENAGKNLVLDFEGSMIPGVARFYKGFGAFPETYFHLYANWLPFPLNFLKRKKV